MKTISMEKFRSQALPEIMAVLMREDHSAVSQGKMTLPQFWALYHIDQSGALTLNGLAERMERSKSTISVLVHRLVERKLVKRTRNKADRRVVYFSLTLTGERLIKEMAETREASVRKMYSVFSAEERALYQLLVKKMLDSSARLVVFFLMMMLLVGGGRVFGETSHSYSLKESVKIGLQKSLLVANAKRERAIARSKKAESLSLAIPQVRGVADYFLYDDENITESGSSRAGLEASWKVFSGGRTASALRAADIYKGLTSDQERRIKTTQVRDIAFAYYKVQLANAQVDVLQQSVKQLKDFESETEKKYKAGTASEFDWLSAKVALANEKPRFIAAQNRLSLARASFLKETFIEDQNFRLSDPLEFVSMKVKMQDMIALGLQKRPELLEKWASVHLREEGIKQEKSAYYPDLDLIGTYNYSDPDPYGFIPGSSGDGWKNHWN